MEESENGSGVINCKAEDTVRCPVWAAYSICDVICRLPEHMVVWQRLAARAYSRVIYRAWLAIALDDTQFV